MAYFFPLQRPKPAAAFGERGAFSTLFTVFPQQDLLNKQRLLHKMLLVFHVFHQVFNISAGQQRKTFLPAGKTPSPTKKSRPAGYCRRRAGQH